MVELPVVAMEEEEEVELPVVAMEEEEEVELPVVAMCLEFHTKDTFTH